MGKNSDGKVRISKKEWHTFKKFLEQMPMILETVEDLDIAWGNFSNYLTKNLRHWDKDATSISTAVLDVISRVRYIFNYANDNIDANRKESRRDKKRNKDRHRNNNNVESTFKSPSYFSYNKDTAIIKSNNKKNKRKNKGHSQNKKKTLVEIEDISNGSL